MTETSGKIRVMLVEDHAHMHKLVVQLLATADDMLLVAQCGNGQEAFICAWNIALMSY